MQAATILHRSMYTAIWTMQVWISIRVDVHALVSFPGTRDNIYYVTGIGNLSRALLQCIVVVLIHLFLHGVHKKYIFFTRCTRKHTHAAWAGDYNYLYSRTVNS